MMTFSLRQFFPEAKSPTVIPFGPRGSRVCNECHSFCASVHVKPHIVDIHRMRRASKRTRSRHEDWNHRCWRDRGTLARDLVRLGHKVRVANSREPASLARLAAETGATAIAPADAVKGAQLVIVSPPQFAIANLSKDLFALKTRFRSKE